MTASGIFDNRLVFGDNLFGVVEFSGAASLFPQHIIDVFEYLFEHELLDVPLAAQALTRW